MGWFWVFSVTEGHCLSDSLIDHIRLPICLLYKLPGMPLSCIISKIWCVTCQKSRIFPTSGVFGILVWKDLWRQKMNPEAVMQRWLHSDIFSHFDRIHGLRYPTDGWTWGHSIYRPCIALCSKNSDYKVIKNAAQ